MKISNYESQYMRLLKKIYEEGYADGTNERTGIATKRIPGAIIQVDVGEEFPILKSKFVAAKTALREIEWIWKTQSSNIKALNAHIWDEWADKKGSIGKAYGYQIDKPVEIYADPVHMTPESYRRYENQAEYVIEYLKEFPNGRWGVVTLWNPDELKDMHLVPCCHTTTWNLDGGRLNCVLDQRSGDMPYGVPFNTTQYAELMIMFAKALSTEEKEIEPGILTHVIADAHIYANQMEGVKKQLRNYELMVSTLCDGDGSFMDSEYACELASMIAEDSEEYGTSVDVIRKVKEVLASEPQFKINAENPYDFWSYTAEECLIENYESMGKIDFGDVAV